MIVGKCEKCNQAIPNCLCNAFKAVRGVDGLGLWMGVTVSTLRKQNKFSQTEIGNYLELTRASIVNIEKGRQKLSAENIYKLACLFNVSPSKFFPLLQKVVVTEVERKIKIPAKTKTVKVKKFKL